ncbi:DUF4184 family protein [Sporosarcina luteola]|uniref:DUF4184 family protein n=1 Tax=Sporosarcina luteola TaxID=582850 RepID=UPI00203DA44F|nr:DUF4184 family protein [Sporosarcina luteola]MCM3709552.1 DUF4184 family protein [Sporosarcina luteola]
MPLTFAHPAAALPFSRNSKYVNFLALVLGSMSPDFEYFLRGKPSGEIGHTFIGFVTLNLPVVSVVYLIYQAYIHRTLFEHLPFFLQETPSEKQDSSKSLKAVVFLYSALFGMLTHVVWDSFTHINGFLVNKLSVLKNTLQVFNYNIPVYKFLQHGSTFVGISAIGIYMFYRATKYNRNRGRGTEPIQKLRYWGSIGLLSIFLFVTWHFIHSIPIELYGVIVVRIIDSVLASLLIVSLCFSFFYRHKKRSF